MVLDEGREKGAHPLRILVAVAAQQQQRTSSRVGSGAWRNFALGCHRRYCAVSLAEMASIAFVVVMDVGSVCGVVVWCGVGKCDASVRFCWKQRGARWEAAVPIQASSLAQGFVLMTSGGTTPMLRHMMRPRVNVLLFCCGRRGEDRVRTRTTTVE